MITKYKQYNESIKHLLVGPTSEEVWKNIGYDRTFNTPEEFFLDIIDGLVDISPRPDTSTFIWWGKNNITYFKYNALNGVLYVDEDKIWEVFKKLFMFTTIQIQKFIREQWESQPQLLVGPSWKIQPIPLKLNKNTNESIKHLLVGPTSEEVFKNLGLDKMSPDDMLHRSVEFGVLQGVKLAIEKGADVHYGNDLLLPKCCECGYYDIVEYVLSLGLNRWINSGLKYACQKNFIDIVGLLLDNGADIHTDNEYCLKISVEYYYFDLTKYLLKRGANIHATDDWCIKKVNSKPGYTKFKNLFNKILSTNEGVKHLLVGPTIEEVWSNLGYNRTFDTPDEFIRYISNNLEKIVKRNTFSYIIYWKYKPQNEVYFEYNSGSLFYSEERIYNILNGVFNMKSSDIESLLKSHFTKEVNSVLRQKKLFWRDI